MSVKFLLRMNQRTGYLMRPAVWLACGVGTSPVEAYDSWVLDYESKLGG
jgi:hypothetical protein